MSMRYGFFALILCFSLLSAIPLETYGADFSCARFTQRERRVPKPASCDDTGGYDLITKETLARPELARLFGGLSDQEINKNSSLKDRALEAKFRMTSNMNGARFHFPSGVVRTVFRGSYHAPQFTPSSVMQRAAGEQDQKVACFENLVRQHRLSKILNYDEHDWPSAQVMTQEEKALLYSKNPGAEYWEFTPKFGRTFQYKFSKARGNSLEAQKRDVMDMVASIIREIEGSPSRPGAAYIHCYGGHHRTGAVYGVLQKCIGKVSVEDVIQEYKCHIGFESSQRAGGYHVDNETLIREFPCEQYFPAR